MQGFGRFKPAAPVRVHLLLAAVIWSGVGGMLLFRAGLLLTGHAFAWFAAAIAVGTAKSLLVLDRAARKNADRIMARQDGRCLGGVYTWKMWGVVALMIVAGRLLRTSSSPLLLVGFLYAAVGWALLFSSRLLWLRRFAN